MSTKALVAYLELAEQIQQMKALRARYAAGSSKDAAVVVNLNLVIDGVALPPNELTFANRAISNRVRATLPALFAAAIAEQENLLDGLKASAKAEYDKLFGP